MQLHDVEQLVSNPVGTCDAATAAGEVGLLNAPGLGCTVLRPDEQAVLAGSNHSDVIPVEAVAAERVDDLDVLVSDLQPWVEPEAPRVEQREHGQYDEQRREPERASVPVDQVRENRDRHTCGKSEG